MSLGTDEVAEIFAIFKNPSPEGGDLTATQRVRVFKEREKTLRGSAEIVRDLLPASMEGDLGLSERIFLNRALTKILTEVSQALQQTPQQVRHMIEESFNSK